MHISPKKNWTVLLAIALICSTQYPVDAASGAKASKNKTSGAHSAPQSEGADYKDGAAFIDSMIKAAESYPDYVFDFTMVNIKGKKQTEVGKFYFKKPRLIRLEEVGSFRKGSVAVLGPGGKVRAKPGGAFKFVSVELPPNSDLLRGANGYPMVDSDLISLAQALKKFIDKDGCVSRVTENPIATAGDSKNYMLEVYHKSLEGQIFKRVAVDPKTMLPVEWWDYLDGQLSSHSVWNNFKGNVGLADDLFTLKGAKTK